MACVNLWELMTTIARNKEELPNRDHCRGVQDAAASKCGYGSELSLAIDPDTGIWSVRIFGHEDDSQYVLLSVQPSGRVSVTRGGGPADLYETRTITF